MEHAGKPTIIGEHVKIVGDVIAEGLALELIGEIEGKVVCAVLTVAPGGRLTGEVEAQKVVVRGLVEGPILAEELVLAPEGRVKGDISCRTVAVETGGFVEGRISQASSAGLLQTKIMGRS